MSIVRRCLLLSLFACSLTAQDGVQVWIKEVLAKKDDADLALVDKISGVRSREAAEGLLQAFEAVSTLLWKREIARGLKQYVGSPETEQPVLTKFANLAGDPNADDGLRTIALAGLEQSESLGHQLLKQIVDSDVVDAVREPAMRAHVKHPVANDAPWYRFLWNYKQEQRKDKKGDIAPPEFNTIRQLAVVGLQQFLGEEEIIDGMRREIDPKIRRALLNTMRKQAMPKTGEMAQWLLERVDYPGADRAEAARILMDRDRKKAVDAFLELAKKAPAVTPEDLRMTMAKLLADLGDEAVDKRLVKQVGKGKPHEKVFALLATEKVADPKVIAVVRKGLTDDALEVRRATAQVLGTRRDRESVPELRKLLASKNPGDARLALEALTAIEGMTSAWLKEVAAFTAHADRDLRNAAIEVLGQARDRRQIEVLLAASAHEDWSTRFCAVDALQALRDKAVVGKLVERLAVETGRMKRRIAEALFQLTAQPFDEDVARWQSWWKEAAATFAVAGEKDVDKALAERERKRLSQRTVVPAKFFGLQIESRRVIFILDISGSMLESMYGRMVGKRPASRIDIAKQEVVNAVKGLEEGTLFNIYSFSSSVEAWKRDGSAVCNDATRKEALEWIDRLGASGATNLYDSVKLAFADKDVDTIFIMSDGEPTNGEVIDPHRIREDVAFWNKHRKVKIHSIAIGGNLEVLEWLAKDAGGNYVQMR